MARHSLTESQRSVMDLRASVLENRDLAAALRIAAAEWAVGGAAEIEVAVSAGDRRFAQDVEQNVLRIAQEATTNALKHGLATRVEIRLQFEAQRLRLTVKDDGVGFDPSKNLAISSGHFGIQGMRERAERAGGELRLSTEPGIGTEVEVTIPVGSDHARMHPVWAALTRGLVHLVDQ
jgi:signal transduction histidine kinase